MHAGIAGAGLMGRLLAWRLQQIGWQVTLFDLGRERAEHSAAYVAAGMLSPYAELQSGDPIIFSMGQDSLALWPQWLANMQKPVDFQQRGSLLVAHSADQGELQQWKNFFSAKLKNPAIVQIVDADWLEKHEPELHFSCGLFLPEEAQIDTRQLLAALYAALLAKGATFYFHTSVNTVSPHVIVTDEETFHFDWVFDCRGYGAKNAMTHLRNVRGEIIYLHAPAVQITRPIRLLHPRYRLYIVPRANDIYVVGASEIEADDSSPISVRSCLELLSAAYSVHPGFAEARVMEILTAKRAAFLDNLPRIRYQLGLVTVNGLYRHGFLIAPVLAEEICRVIRQDSLRYPQCIEETLA